MKVTIPTGAHPAPDEPMDPAEVLRLSESFDPTPLSDDRKLKVMRLALEMIVQQAQGGQRLHVDGTGMTAYPLIIRTAEQALRECK